MEISADMFARAVEDILDGSVEEIERAVAPAVRKGCKAGRDGCRENASAKGLHITGAYIKGFSYKVDKKSHSCVGEVGNSIKPGLVHLLEKGHATIGGGHVPAYPHVAPAAEAAFKVYEAEVEKAVEEAL